MKKKFSGAYTALATPFRDGGVDWDSYRKLIRFQLESGINGLLVCGSTGEASSLSQEEYLKAAEICVEESSGKVPVICGTGTNSTGKTVTMARLAAKTGIDALLVIVPYYNKPPQRGLVEHFRRVADSVDKDIIVYNIPSRTGINMLPETLLEIMEKCPNVRGVKEASGNMDQVSETAMKAAPGFSVLSGDDSLTLPMMSVGADGVISVVSNIMPAETARMCSLFAGGRTEDALKIHRKIFPLVKALFCETNPIPVKYALSLMGFGSSETRLPLSELKTELRAGLKKAMLSAGINL